MNSTGSLNVNHAENFLYLVVEVMGRYIHLCTIDMVALVVFFTFKISSIVYTARYTKATAKIVEISLQLKLF